MARVGLQDNFEFSLVSDFTGYVSSKDKTLVDPRVLIHGSKNVYKKLSGTIAVRPGLKRRGSADTSAGGITSSFEWNTSLGATIPLRYISDTGKLQFESDIVASGTYVWYDLLTGLSASDISFDTWWDNTNKKDVLLFVLGSSTMYHWSGALALFVSATATVITLDRDATTSGFSASGSIIINGTPATYSGVSGSTLTGVSVDFSATAANSVVIEATGTNSNTPASSFTANFIKVNNNQVAVGSYTSRIVYISKNTSYVDYSQSTPRVPGDGETIILDDTANGIGIRQGNFHISAGTSDWYVVSFTPITVGTTLTEQTKVDKQHMSELAAAKNHNFIDSLGDDIIYLDQANQLRAFGTFRNLNTPRYPVLSLQVQDELYDEDFTGGHLRVVSDIVYLTAPNSGRDWMYQIREQISPMGNIGAERVWHPPQVRNVSRFAVIDGVLYGHSNANPQIYQIWNTLQWHDDSPTDDPLPYDCLARFAYRQHNRRQGMINFDKVYWEGYMTEGSKVYAGVYYDYQGATDYQSPAINDPALSRRYQATFYTATSGPSLGDSSLGDNPLGDGLTTESNDQETLPKFRKITDVNPSDCFEYALEIYSQDLDCRWELLALGPNTQVSENRPVQIRG